MMSLVPIGLLSAGLRNIQSAGLENVQQGNWKKGSGQFCVAHLVALGANDDVTLNRIMGVSPYEILFLSLGVRAKSPLCLAMGALLLSIDLFMDKNLNSFSLTEKITMFIFKGALGALLGIGAAKAADYVWDAASQAIGPLFSREEENPAA